MGRHSFRLHVVWFPTPRTAPHQQAPTVVCVQYRFSFRIMVQVIKVSLIIFKPEIDTLTML